jgi:PAS domain S-box-containing protein
MTPADAPLDGLPSEPNARLAALEARLIASHARERALEEERATLREVLDHSPDVILVKDHAGYFLVANRTLATLYGTTPEAMVGKDDGDFSATPEQAAFFRENVLGIMARGDTEIVFEDATDERTGETRHFQSIKKPFLGPDGLPRILVIAHDITDVLRAQAEVALSAQRLDAVLSATGEGVWDWDLTTGRLEHNQRWYDLLGFTEDDMTGTIADFERCLLPAEAAGVRAALDACLRTGTPYRHEHGMRCLDGRVIRVFDRGDVVSRDAHGAPTRMVGSFADITAQVAGRDLLRQSLREKETLLKEVHHRVKNNLQIISSLLALQADAAAPALTRPLLESAARVRSMALIHQQLYLADDLGHIDLGAYARSVARELVGTLAPDAHADVDADPVTVTVDEAVPCGLVLNELLTNALKHGRSADGSARVAVTLRDHGDRYDLTVRDHGPGLPADFDLQRAGDATSLGMKLILSLVRQLRAELSFHTDDGAWVAVRVRRPTATAATAATP